MNELRVNNNNYEGLKSQFSYENTDGERVLTEPISLEFSYKNSNCRVLIPAGFSWKPTGPKCYFKKRNINTNSLEFPSLLHDWLYKVRGHGVIQTFTLHEIKLSRSSTDVIFYNYCRFSGIEEKDALNMWWWIHALGYLWWIT
jgi:hypothetical protein